MKKLTSTLSLVLLALAVIAVPAFSQTIVPSTTLSAAVTSSSSQSNTFRLTSTSGITAGNTMLFIEGEADFVNAVTSTTVTVTRGAGPASRVSQHPNGATVWYGPPSYFQSPSPTGYPFGTCSRTNGLVLPYIDILNNVFSDCLGGVWVSGDSVPTAVSAFRVPAPNTGATAYSSVGTATTTAATTMYCTEVDLPYNKLLTGLAILNGGTVATDKHLVVLYDAAGNLLANSAVAGALSAGANTYQTYAFTAKYFAVAPAAYFGCVQANGTTDNIRTLTTGTQDTYLTKGVTGQTFGTIPATITVPTTFTTVVGAYLFAY